MKSRRLAALELHRSQHATAIVFAKGRALAPLGLVRALLISLKYCGSEI